MSFTALKGWNFHTETFDTLDQFFNPLINTNHSLARSATLSQLLNGISKVFSREYLAQSIIDNYRTHYGEGTEAFEEFITALAHDPRIHPLHLASLNAEYGEHYNDDTEEYEPDDNHVFINFYGIRKQSFDYWNMRVALDFNSLTVAECVEKVINEGVSSSRLINLNALTSGEIDYLFDVTGVPLAATESSKIWGYHFGRITFRQYFNYEGVLTDADRHINLSTLLTEVRPEHAFTHDASDSTMIRWIVPTTTGDRRMLHRLHSYSTKASSLIQGVLRQSNELSDNLYGVELEVSSDLSIPNIVDAPEKTYCFVKQDSSISGSRRNMYEIVSVPATIKVHIKSWAQIFEKVGYGGFDVTKNTNNGMHIHVDMAAFNNNSGSPDNLHLKHFAWFFINPVNFQFQLEVSERTNESMEKYSKLPKFYTTTLPSIFRDTLSYIQRPFRGIVAFKEDPNTGQHVTIECRMFKGIPSLGNMVKNLEYIDSVFDFTRKTCFQSNTLNNYLTYLDNTPSNRYTTLKEFLSRIGQDEIKEGAAIARLLFGQSDPEKMINLLRKNNTTVTNLNVLNNLLPGVKFGFNKRGELMVIESNRARLYDMDIPLQQKLTRFKGSKTNVSHSHT